MPFTPLLSLDQDLLQRLPLLKIQNGSTIEYYRLEVLTQGEMLFANTKKSDDGFFCNVNRFKNTIDIGIIVNFQDFYIALKDSSIEQELIEYQNDHYDI